MNNNENIDKHKALEELLTMLQKVEKSVAEEGTISAGDLEVELGVKYVVKKNRVIRW